LIPDYLILTILTRGSVELFWLALYLSKGYVKVGVTWIAEKKLYGVGVSTEDFKSFSLSSNLSRAGLFLVLALIINSNLPVCFLLINYLFSITIYYFLLTDFIFTMVRFILIVLVLDTRETFECISNQDFLY
jgi:hypothetical protein